MLRSLNTSILIFFLYFTISVRCAKPEQDEKYEALIFSTDTPRMIYDAKRFAQYEYPEFISSTAIACPNEWSGEEAFNDNHSLGKNSLFVRETYEPSHNSKDIDYKICKTPYKVSVVYHTMNVEFQFGFEIYHDKSKFNNKNFVESKRWHYDLITNTHSNTNNVLAFVPTPLTSIISQLPVYPTPYLNDKTQLGFVWILRFYSKFNFRLNRLAQVIYHISHTPRGVSKCDDWNLGNEYFTKLGISIDDLYSEENQARMLEGVKIPLSKAQDGNEDIEDASCLSENQCFVKWSAIPAQQFHFMAAKPISCSNLLAVPIWKSTIGDVLKKLDNFITVVSQVISYPPKGVITVHSGVYGDLQLPTTITLAESDIPAPDIIYKLIKFNQTVCKDDNIKYGKPNDSESNDDSEDEIKEDNEKDATNVDNDEEEIEANKTNNELEKGTGSEDEKSDELLEDSNEEEEEEERKKPGCFSRETAIIVVIHNNPNFNPVNDKICDDMCEFWGWDEIQIRRVAGKQFKSKYIYCCGVSDSEVRNKLGINNDNNVEYIFPFSLRFIFVPNFEQMNFTDTTDLRDPIVEVYKDAFEEEYDESESDENSEEELETEKLKKIRAGSFKIRRPRHGNDEPKKTETDLVGR